MSFYGGFLLLILAAFRVEKLLHLKAPLDLSLWAWLNLLLPEALFVVAVESALLLMKPSASGRRQRIWMRIVFVVHVLFLAAAVVEHQFFVSTGSRLQLYVLVYAIQNAGQLLGLVGGAADGQFFLRAALAVLALLLSWRLIRRHSPPTVGKSVRTKALGVFGVAVVSLGLLPRTATSVTPFASAALVELAFGRFGSGEMSEIRGNVRELYRSPKITSEPVRRPNVVLIILESTRADTIASGPDTPASPFLSSLAAEGMSFSSAYTTVSHTTKAIVGIMCGMYPRVSMDFIEASYGMLPLQCLPDLMATLGYRTAYFQTAFGGFENREGLVRNLGFDHWETGDDLESERFPRLAYLGLDDAAMLAPALDWIAVRPEQPFFLGMLTVVAHHPYLVPGADSAGRSDRAKYVNAVQYVDSTLKQFFEQMKQRGLTENTVFVVVGDHGEAFGEHGRSQHDSVPYEEVSRIPLIIYGPGVVDAPKQVKGLRTQLDILPTVLELVGAEWSGLLPGKSLLSTEGHEEVFTACWYNEYCLALVTPARKYIYNYDNGPVEAFDLVADPHEKKNLAGQLPPEEVRNAVYRMQSWRDSISAFYER